MQKVKVYDSAGNEVYARPVDAREIVANGGRYDGDKLPEKTVPVKKIHPAEAKAKK